MQFFNFKSVIVPGLKIELIRFPEFFIGYPVGGQVRMMLTPEKLTVYADGRECLDALPQITETESDADMAREITLYNPLTGATAGTFTLGQFAAMVYSIQIDVYERGQARLAQIEADRLAALAAANVPHGDGASVEPISPVTP